MSVAEAVLGHNLSELPSLFLEESRNSAHQWRSEIDAHCDNLGFPLEKMAGTPEM
jgi:hypothetical protein